MNTLMKWGGDGLPAGTITTPAGMGGTGDSVPAALSGTGTKEIVATGVRSPVFRLTQLAGSADAVQWNYSADGHTFGRWYWTPRSTLATSHIIIQLNDGATKAATINVTSTGVVRIIDSTNATIASSAAGVVAYPGGPYRIEWTIDHAANSMTVRVYNGDTATLLATVTGTGNYLTQTSRMYAGNPTSTPTAEVMDFDDGQIDGGVGATWIGSAVPLPTADAGPDQSVAPSTLVTLTAAASTAVSPKTISSYAWAQTAGTSVTLSGSGATRTFTPTVAGTYTFQVTVTDSGGVTNTDTVTITVTSPALLKWNGDGLSAGAFSTSSAGTGDTAPTNVTGGTQTVDASGPRSPRIKQVQLAAAACYSYWDHAAATQRGGRASYDPTGTLATNHVVIQFNNGATKAAAINVASSGLIRIVDSTNATIASSATGLITAGGGPYRIEWVIDHTAGTMGVKLFLGDSSTPLASISGAGNYLSQSTRIYFGNTATSPTIETIYWDDILGTNVAAYPGPAASPPVARAGSDQTVDPNLVSGATFTLDGSTSTDADGTITSYVWEDITGTPTTVAGSGATRTVTTPTTVNGTTKTYRLTVTDNSGATSIDTVVITVRPHNIWRKSAGSLIAVRRKL